MGDDPSVISWPPFEMFGISARRADSGRTPRSTVRTPIRASAVPCRRRAEGIRGPRATGPRSPSIDELVDDVLFLGGFASEALIVLLWSGHRVPNFGRFRTSPSPYPRHRPVQLGTSVRGWLTHRVDELGAPNWWPTAVQLRWFRHQDFFDRCRNRSPRSLARPPQADRHLDQLYDHGTGRRPDREDRRQAWLGGTSRLIS